MDDQGLSQAFDRAERALQRIEQSIANRPRTNPADERLRDKVREAVAELDQLIREASA